MDTKELMEERLKNAERLPHMHCLTPWYEGIQEGKYTVDDLEEAVTSLLGDKTSKRE